MREGLKRDVEDLLGNYLADLEYWCAAYTVDDVNSVTGGVEFETEEDVNAHRVLVKAVLKELRDV